MASAAAIIIAHSHPSGDPTPSEADIKITRDLIRAGQLLKIELLDHVIVGNAAKIVMTAGKSERSFSYSHSGYPGGLRTTSYARELETRPEEVVRRAIKGMLPKGPLGHKMLSKLKVYAGPDHPHAAQMPIPLDLPAARRAS